MPANQAVGRRIACTHVRHITANGDSTAPSSAVKAASASHSATSGRPESTLTTVRHFCWNRRRACCPSRFTSTALQPHAICQRRSRDQSSAPESNRPRSCVLFVRSIHCLVGVYLQVQVLMACARVFSGGLRIDRHWLGSQERPDQSDQHGHVRQELLTETLSRPRHRNKRYLLQPQAACQQHPWRSSCGAGCSCTCLYPRHIELPVQLLHL